MTDANALKVAIDLFHLPSQVRPTRLRPLPEGAKLILRIAAGDADAMQIARGLSDRSPTVIREAAVFFIEQILLDHAADGYRTLGLDRNASINELRTHMALLMKWLNPDINNDERRSTMARQVLRAWKQVNAPDNHRRHQPSAERLRTNTHQRRIEHRTAGEHSAADSISKRVSRASRLSLLMRFAIAQVRRRFVYRKI